MQNTVRLILIIFLLVLILFNYNSTRILNLAISRVNTEAQQRAKLISGQLSEELQRNPNILQSSKQGLEDFLRSHVRKYGIAGIVLYDKGTKLAQAIDPEVEGLNPILQKPPQLPWARQGKYLLIQGKYRLSDRLRYYALILDLHDVADIERSTKIITYSNFLLILFGAFVGFYFFESTFRSYRMLIQTARSADTGTAQAGTNRNDADFLIATFKGVIAKLKEKEQELAKLHQSEKARADDVQQLNQDLIRSLSSGLILIDQAKKIRVFNQAAETILGLSRVAVLGYPYEPLLQKVSPAFKEDIDRCFTQRSNINRTELQIYNRENELRYLGASIMPLQDRQQNFSGVICLFSDITEFKMLQQLMSQKEKFASLGEMAAGVAHEFRNSVATIAGYVQLLDNKVSDEQRKYTGPVERELDMLQKVVNDFLSFARPVELQMQAVDLGQLLRECTDEVQVSQRDSGIEINVDGVFQQVIGDELMLRQVFLNLIRNAVESVDGSPRSGKVQISGANSMNGKFVIIDVRDNGAGIKAEDLPRIFTPFFTTKQKGAGLGLAIVQKLVLQHNGTITVDTSLEGSLFRVQLPVR
jgi:PAS domain S-box-containing protein